MNESSWRGAHTVRQPHPLGNSSPARGGPKGRAELPQPHAVTSVPGGDSRGKSAPGVRGRPAVCGMEWKARAGRAGSCRAGPGRGRAWPGRGGAWPQLRALPTGQMRRRRRGARAATGVTPSGAGTGTGTRRLSRSVSAGGFGAGGWRRGQALGGPGDPGPRPSCHLVTIPRSTCWMTQSRVIFPS